MAEWKDIIDGMKGDYPSGIMFRDKDGNESSINNLVNRDVSQTIWTEYLICEPHPHAEMIIEWAKTGRPVYWNGVQISNPGWDAYEKYSFNPPRQYYRVYIDTAGSLDIAYCERDPDDLDRWVDDDWRYYESD